MKFIEGSWYEFTISKVIAIPAKGNYYILEHQLGRKLLLNEVFYSNYEFIVGQKIRCKIDKVNCTGQIFLEPEHPYYKEGQKYTFNIFNVTQIYDKVYILDLIDYNKEKIQTLVQLLEVPNSDQPIEMKVLRVKKGLPQLEYSCGKISPALNNDKLLNQLIELNVFKEIVLNNELFLFLANDKTITLLKSRHYKHYGIKVGQNVNCQIIGVLSNGLVKVEPNNPWYRIGEIYTFKNNGIESTIDLDGNIACNLVLHDNNGIKCNSKVPVDLIDDYKSKKEVRCMVVGFKKGRPLLEIDQNMF